jgi:hypothetical protein
MFLYFIMNNFITIENQGENSYSALKENESMNSNSCMIKSKSSNPMAGSKEFSERYEGKDLVTKSLILTTSIIGMILLYTMLNKKIK